MFSPFITKSVSVREIMFKVLLGLVPGIILYTWYFGPAILISITLASITALATEAAPLAEATPTEFDRHAGCAPPDRLDAGARPPAQGDRRL